MKNATGILCTCSNTRPRFRQARTKRSPAWEQAVGSAVSRHVRIVLVAGVGLGVVLVGLTLLVARSITSPLGTLVAACRHTASGVLAYAASWMVAAVGAHMDITDRKRAEEAARAGQALNLSITEASADCIANARKRKALERALGASIGLEVWSEMLPAPYQEPLT